MCCGHVLVSGATTVVTPALAHLLYNTVIRPFLFLLGFGSRCEDFSVQTHPRPRGSPEDVWYHSPSRNIYHCTVQTSGGFVLLIKLIAFFSGMHGEMVYRT